jgi:hypothetical protein
MTVFAILMPNLQPSVVAEITRNFPSDHFKLSDTQYLVSSSETAAEVSAKIGVYDLKNPDKPATGNAVIFATSSYFGRAHATVWEWLKTKLETPPRV